MNTGKSGKFVMLLGLDFGGGGGGQLPPCPPGSAAYVLKHEADFEALGDEHICWKKIETHLSRPVEVATLTYPEFGWWLHSRMLQKLQRKTNNSVFRHNDFGDFMVAKQMQSSQQQMTSSNYQSILYLALFPSFTWPRVQNGGHILCTCVGTVELCRRYLWYFNQWQREGYTISTLSKGKKILGEEISLNTSTCLY